MTPTDRLAARISSEHQLEVATAIQIVDLVLNGLAQAVARGGVVDIPGVGTLRTETVPERRDHHPSTGVAMITPASARVVFEPAIWVGKAQSGVGPNNPNSR